MTSRGGFRRDERGTVAACGRPPGPSGDAVATLAEEAANAAQRRAYLTHPDVVALRVERVGIDKIRAVVVDDREGIAAHLDAAIQASIDAYQDPWQEAYTAARPTEFSSLLPVIQ